MTRFCLIRHGQTDWNLEGRYQGQSDVPLNPVGKVQAHALARQLSGQSFSAIFTSDLIRARETADILASVLKALVIVDTRLREINQGEWEGQLVEVLRAKYNGSWEMRTADPTGVRAPGGETVSEVAARMYAAMDDIASQFPEGAVLITSHGFALATVICKVKGMDLGQAYRVIPGNAEPVWVTWPVPG